MQVAHEAVLLNYVFQVGLLKQSLAINLFMVFEGTLIYLVMACEYYESNPTVYIYISDAQK